MKLFFWEKEAYIVSPLTPTKYLDLHRVVGYLVGTVDWLVASEGTKAWVGYFFI